MFSVQIFNREQQYTWHLHFRKEADAVAVYQKLCTENAEIVEVLDDAGHRWRGETCDTTAVMLVDLAKERAIGDELAISKAVADTRLNSRAAADPALKAARMMAGAPANLQA